MSPPYDGPLERIRERVGMIGEEEPPAGPAASRATEGERMAKEHRYQLTVTWTGNRGEGTSSYRSYDRDHEISGEHLPSIAGSSDLHFRGNPSRWNPEQLLVASAS